MLWFNLSLASAASKAANQAITKKLTDSFSVFEIAAFGQLATGILIFPLIFLPSLIYIPVDLAFHKAASITILLNIIAILLLIEAIKRSDLSYAIPLLGLTPVFTIFMGWIFRGEVLNLSGMIGILLVVIGALGIDTTSLKDWVSLGGKRILKDKGVLLVVVVALIYSVTSVYDKTATLLSDPFSFIWFSAVVRTVALMILYFAWKAKNQTEKEKSILSMSNLVLFFFLGLTFLAEATSQMFALQTGLVAYVIAIKRLSILMTSVAGMVIFKEAFSWARFSGVFLIIAGAGVIYLS